MTATAVAEMRATNSAAQVASGAGRAAGSAQSDKDAEDPNLRERKRVATVKVRLVHQSGASGVENAPSMLLKPLCWHSPLLCCATV